MMTSTAANASANMNPSETPTASNARVEPTPENPYDYPTVQDAVAHAGRLWQTLNPEKVQQEIREDQKKHPPLQKERPPHPDENPPQTPENPPPSRNPPPQPPHRPQKTRSHHQKENRRETRPRLSAEEQ